MQTNMPQIAEYLRRFRQGDADTAFHGLLDMGHEILPQLIAAFQDERDSRVREFLVEVIWQHRQESVIPFLGEALLDPEARVWREALDGLVALASPAALDTLRAARTRSFPGQGQREDSRRWLEEAIEQVETEMRTHRA
jgi:HEAT repeat protein